MFRYCIICLVLCTVPYLAAAEPVKPSARDIEFFEKSVRPLLHEHCVSCHGPKKQQSGLRFDAQIDFLNGNEDGPVINIDKPDTSRLLLSIRRGGDYAMPPDKPLSQEQVKVLEDWVKRGAPYPADEKTTAKTDATNHWAFQPIQEIQPVLQNGNQNPIDAFIHAKLHQQGIKPLKKADKRVLARRLYIALLGLPPTAAQIDAFVQDQRPDAYLLLVQELLGNKHYGERWARHWLDVARYADNKGYVFTEDRNYPYAYTYRDYLIRSLNQDKPFNRMILEQLAADQLKLDDNADLAAMGFLTVGRRFSNNIHDITDDRIDVVTRGFMGFTVACARCHDHKYDPIPTADYYSLYGVFTSSTEPNELPQIGPAEDREAYDQFLKTLTGLQAQVDSKRRELLDVKLLALNIFVGSSVVNPKTDRILNRADRNQLTDLQRKADNFKAKSVAEPPRAMVMNDLPKPVNAQIFVRGNPNNRGEQVQRRVPHVLTSIQPHAFTKGSGRLELAEAIASDRNPLTARVIVNRVWAWHFGEGLVRTPSDFGLRSEPPTHPELLDWLTTQFIRDGWSIKKLHTWIVTSEAFQRSSFATADQIASDPENRQLAYFPRLRYDFETLRDSMLFVSGKLDEAIGGRSFDLLKHPVVPRRTMYGYIDRQNLPSLFRIFDFASPEQHVAQRFQTTVPQQALYLMNSGFVSEVVQSISDQLASLSELGDAEIIEHLYIKILSRHATEVELKTAIDFLQESRLRRMAHSGFSDYELLIHVLLMTNEFVYMD